MKLYAIVDYEDDFVIGALGFPGAQILDKGIVSLGRELAGEDGSGALVLEIHDTHEEDYLETREGKVLPIPHAIRGTRGWEIFGETGRWLRTAMRTVIEKPGFGIPPEKMLDLPDGVDEIHIAGLVTNMCVISVAVCMRARYPEARVIVHRDLCASFDPDLHDKALDVMAGLQMEVV